MAGQRLIHIVCPFWKAFYDGCMKEGVDKKKYDSGHASWQHGFLAFRRRESAMMVQRCVGWRLDQQNLYHINELMDMSNAFGCMTQDSLLASAEEIFLERM